jgi:hypothetical protein
VQIGVVGDAFLVARAGALRVGQLQRGRAAITGHHADLALRAGLIFGHGGAVGVVRGQQLVGLDGGVLHRNLAPGGSHGGVLLAQLGVRHGHALLKESHRRAAGQVARERQARRVRVGRDRGHLLDVPGAAAVAVLEDDAGGIAVRGGLGSRFRRGYPAWARAPKLRWVPGPGGLLRWCGSRPQSGFVDASLKIDANFQSGRECGAVRHTLPFGGGHEIRHAGARCARRQARAAAARPAARPPRRTAARRCRSGSPAGLRRRRLPCRASPRAQRRTSVPSPGWGARARANALAVCGIPTAAPVTAPMMPASLTPSSHGICSPRMKRLDRF